MYVSIGIFFAVTENLPARSYIIRTSVVYLTRSLEEVVVEVSSLAR